MPRPTLLIAFGGFGLDALQRLLHQSALRGVLRWKESQTGGVASAQRQLQDLGLAGPAGPLRALPRGHRAGALPGRPNSSRTSIARLRSRPGGLSAEGGIAQLVRRARRRLGGADRLRPAGSDRPGSAGPGASDLPRDDPAPGHPDPGMPGVPGGFRFLQDCRPGGGEPQLHPGPGLRRLLAEHRLPRRDRHGPRPARGLAQLHAELGASPGPATGGTGPLLPGGRTHGGGLPPAPMCVSTRWCCFWSFCCSRSCAPRDKGFINSNPWSSPSPPPSASVSWRRAPWS